MKSAIEKVIGLYGLTGVGNFFSPPVTPQAVIKWKKNKEVPIERCLAIERATNGAVTRKELRPNDWRLIWPELEEKRAA
jgi:DNA-binding transcriptional regulator YdaS (Cro superfamily)